MMAICGMWGSEFRSYFFITVSSILMISASTNKVGCVRRAVTKLSSATVNKSAVTQYQLFVARVTLAVQIIIRDVIQFLKQFSRCWL
jgi:hypothetical protein